MVFGNKNEKGTRSAFSQEHVPESTSLSACRCSATHLCGPYLVVDLSRACGCCQSMQVSVNAYSERFVFLDALAVHGAFTPESTAAEQLSTFTACLSDSDSSPKPEPFSPSAEFIKLFQFPATSKRFSLVDLALLLTAVQREHVDHRWMDSCTDCSLIEFTSAEVFAFLNYFLELDWRNQVLEYRRSITKRFYDKRVIAWNTVSTPNLLHFSALPTHIHFSGYPAHQRH